MSPEVATQANTPAILLNTGRSPDAMRDTVDTLRGRWGSGQEAVLTKPGYVTVDEPGWPADGFRGSRAMEKAVRLLAKKVGVEGWDDRALKLIAIRDGTLARLRELGMAVVMVDDDPSARKIFSDLFGVQGMPDHHVTYGCHCEALEGADGKSGLEVSPDGRVFVEVSGNRLQVAAVVLDCTISCEKDCRNSEAVDFVNALGPET